VANLNNTHFDDTTLTGQYQKEVYMLARDLLRKMSTLPDNMVRKLTVIDVGCGSGWKLVNYLSREFKTIGIETEPALSFLRKTFPDQVNF
jgi:2-polyprenyl-3-methyl-5-hydroxy-6-metoxy-1,4-benzoquinol methylase